MRKTVYEDYKYSMQDTSRFYVGCKYTFGEILEDEEIMFKFRMIMQRYVLPEADSEDTLETHLYYLPPESFLVKIYKQLKAKVKVNRIEERKGLLSKDRSNGKKQYVTKLMTVEELSAIPPAEKEKQGIVIQELSVSKFALAGL